MEKPLEATMHNTWARSSTPDFLPAELSRAIAVISFSFNMDFVRSVKTDFGPSSTNVDTFCSSIPWILSIKLTGLIN